MGFLDLVGSIFGGGGGGGGGFSSFSPSSYDESIASVTPAGYAGVPSAPSGGGFNFGDLASGIERFATPIAGFAKSVLPLAQLGATGMGVAGNIKAMDQMAQQTKLAERAQRLQEESARNTAAAAAPLTAFGTKQLALAEGGQLPEAVEQQIENWLRGAKQQMADYFSRTGQGESEALTNRLSWLDQMAAGMRANYLQEMQRMGMTGLAQGAGAFGQAGGGAATLQRGAQSEAGTIQALMAEANRALAALSGAAG